MILVVSAYWCEPCPDPSAVPLAAGHIKGSGAVVTFTPEQVDQPGLRQHLRNLQLQEAADYAPRAAGA